MTQENLQDAVVADLETLFKTYKLTNSQGVERAVRVFSQDLPIREGGDEETDPQAPPEPYVVVRLRQGELPAADTQQTVDVVLAVCVHDPDPNRQGYRDTLHIVNEIMRHYGSNGVVARRYVAQYPIQWALQEEDTHPYYFAGVAVKFDAPAIFKEVPEA